MSLTLALSPQLETLTRALVELGYYGNISEIGRAALERFLQDQPPQRRMRLALHLYAQDKATVSRVAEIAGLSLTEARRVLREEGLLRPAQGAPEARRARAKAAAQRHRARHR